MRSFREDMSCCTVCSAVLSCAVTSCFVESSLDEAFQPNPKPAIATKPRTMTAGNCQDEPFLVSMMCSSDIVKSFLLTLMWANDLDFNRPVTRREQATSQKAAREQGANMPVSQ